MKMTQRRNEIDVYTIKADSYAKMLPGPKQGKAKENAADHDSLINVLASRIWYCELEIEHLKAESLKLQLCDLEKEIEEKNIAGFLS